jgi:hypothetical protein
VGASTSHNPMGFFHAKKKLQGRSRVLEEKNYVFFAEDNFVFTAKFL